MQDSAAGWFPTNLPRIRLEAMIATCNLQLLNKTTLLPSWWRRQDVHPMFCGNFRHVGYRRVATGPLVTKKVRLR